MDTTDRPVRDGHRAHYLVPFLQLFVLVCAGNANMLLLAATPWGTANAVPRFAVTLGLWALAAFGAYRALTTVPRGPGSGHAWMNAFALFSGALCAAEIIGGFLFMEAVASAFITAAASMEAVGGIRPDAPRRVLIAAGAHFLGAAAVMLANSAQFAIAAGTAALAAMIVLLLYGPRADSKENGGG